MRILAPQTVRLTITGMAEPEVLELARDGNNVAIGQRVSKTCRCCRGCLIECAIVEIVTPASKYTADQTRLSADRADDADGTLKFVETLFGRSGTTPKCARPETGHKRHGDLAKPGCGVDIAAPPHQRTRE